MHISIPWATISLVSHSKYVIIMQMQTTLIPERVLSSRYQWGYIAITITDINDKCNALMQSLQPRTTTNKPHLVPVIDKAEVLQLLDVLIELVLPRSVLLEQPDGPTCEELFFHDVPLIVLERKIFFFPRLH